ncbi:helix-turn-helix domain-containing protein [Streptomyces sp. Vc74B-19]|uniref:PucR family transcriptional regulator n=1 Tax=unclassified Streptomyces TaxID=2593676 RepID=UPI001BFCD2D1|nr:MULTISPECIES: helix-turn-helix domain-containing protein [unclassified Streptomyces]MBT3162683.1 helix-turn-helix domain-containing protein [Streptomyces sp. Vc74B-19]MCO4697502.1 helix-turn-helix domain-containing protein [Streptomyces sp. RO-S4]MDU0304487.1 helix-turn-helix domain-containing protein [Streptomyces sp. PAL114]
MADGARTRTGPTRGDAPLTALPTELLDHLRPFLDEITEEIVRTIGVEIAEYARPADETYTHVIKRGVAQALEGFLARLSGTGTDWEDVRATYRRIGKGEADEGRSLDSFQAALRIGARVTWRRVCELFEVHRLPPDVLIALGETIFLHLDEMAAATASGYTEARLHAAGELQQRRGRLIDLLTADPAVSAEAVADLARTAQWPLPREIAVVVADLPEESGSVRPIVPTEFLARFDGQPGIIVVPDPQGPGRERAIAGALRGLNAALGPTVALDSGARSLRWALDALDLARRGVLPGTGLVRCTDHLATLLLFRDEDLVDAIARQYLGPLDAVRPPQRERLAETLLCWLSCARNASEVAQRLAVHPQTVRYRLRQLEEVFGDQLRDPTAQFEMQLALRSLRLRRPPE